MLYFFSSFMCYVVKLDLMLLFLGVVLAMRRYFLAAPDDWKLEVFCWQIRVFIDEQPLFLANKSLQLVLVLNFSQDFLGEVY